MRSCARGSLYVGAFTSYVSYLYVGAPSFIILYLLLPFTLFFSRVALVGGYVGMVWKDGNLQVLFSTLAVGTMLPQLGRCFPFRLLISAAARASPPLSEVA